MRDNYVRLVGTVKRGTEAEKVREGLDALSFCLVCPSDGRPVYVDCLAYGESVDALDGYVEEGEALEVEGHLSYRTYTDGVGRQKTAMYVHVDAVSER